MNDLARIEKLRTLVAEEKILALGLRDKFVNPIFRTRADHIADDADMILISFLGSSLERWLPEQIERRNLDNVEQAIRLLLTGPREALSCILVDFGPEVEVAG